MKRKIVTTVICIVSALFGLAPSEAKKAATKEVDGKQVFQQYCASCHAGGGNTVKPSCPVAESKELASVMSFKSYLSEPPGHMPYYQHVVKNEKILAALYNYCKTLKRQPIKQAMH